MKDWNKVWSIILKTHQDDIQKLTNIRAKDFLFAMNIINIHYDYTYQKEESHSYYGDFYESFTHTYRITAEWKKQTIQLRYINFVDSYDFFSSFDVIDKQSHNKEVHNYFHFKNDDGFYAFWSFFRLLIDEIDKEYSCMRDWEIKESKKVLKKYQQYKKR